MSLYWPISIGKMFVGDEPHERPVSPIFISGGKDLQMCRNGLQEDSGTVKIRRIPLNRTAVVEVLKAESPSCIWVRLTNHITDSLILTEPCDLVPRWTKDGIANLEVLKEFEYCMAPLKDRAYARCRVMEVHDDAVKVFFIDEATDAWLKKECLAYMPKDFFYHPWQAIMVSLCGLDIRPRCLRYKERPVWTAQQCATLRQILNSFQLVKTRTVKSSIIYNDYRKPVMVEMYGILEGYTDTSPDRGISIAALLAANCCGRVQNRRIANAAYFSPVPTKTECSRPPTVEEIPPFRRMFPSDWRRSPSTNDQSSFYNENAIEWQNWSPQAARIPPIEVKWLDDHGYCTTEQEYLVNIEGSQTQSPYEFYARPIKRERIRSIESDSVFGGEGQLQSECDAMLSAHDELRKKATMLDAFYSLEENRSPIEKSQCVAWLKDNIRVFAICACSEERGAYTGEWQRVEVLSCNDFANVLYLDSGGTELVLPHSLYKIHPNHCTYPAMCMQLCMFGVAPNRVDGRLEWGEGAKNLWRELLREDLPVMVSVLKRLNSNGDDQVLPVGEPAWRRPGVMFIQFIRVHGDNVSILEKFCNAILSPNNGIPCLDVPCKWI